MSQWQIDPAVVTGILTEVCNQAAGEAGVPGSGLAGAVTQAGAEGVVNGSAVCVSDAAGPPAPGGRLPARGDIYLGAVPAALATMLGEVLQDMGKVGDRVVAGVVGVSAATLAYQYGQQDMCGAAEQAMATAAGSGDLSWFEANGFMGAAQ